MKNAPRWIAGAILEDLPDSAIWLVLALLLLALVAGGVILGSRPASATVPQPARSDAEARLFLAATPCPRCRSTDAPWWHDAPSEPHGQVDGPRITGQWRGRQVQARQVRRYTSRCQTCRLTRTFHIQLAEHDASTGLFGGPERSTLLDAGQWLAYVDAQAQPADGPPTRNALRTAAAAIEEVLKFIPPGKDCVSRDDLCAGLAYFDQQPERFRRAELVQARKALLRRAQIS